MTEDSSVWFAVVGICILWSVGAAFTGAGLSAPFLVGTLALVFGANAEARRWAMDKMSWAFSGSSLRFALVMIGVMILWQTVGLELAFFAAGDVLAYLEVFTAVSLMAAQNRFSPVKAAVVRWAAARLRPLRRLDVGGRTRRTRPKTPPSSDDADGPAGVWAFA